MEPSGVDLSTTLSPTAAGRRFPLSMGAVLAAALVACSPAASGAPSATPVASPGGAASTAPAPTAEARAIFHIAGDAPVIPRTIVPDRNAILPGAVTVDGDGTYHAWVTAFTTAPGTQDLHHLTSTDGVTWTLQVDDSLAGLSDGLGNPGALPASVVQAGDEWAMYFTGTLASEQRGWDIWRATAPGLDGPWTRSEEPVLGRGEAGSWDAGGLDFPTVVALEAGYEMFYSGIPTTETDTGSVGRATSEDGIEWTKDEGPVLEPGICGGFDDRAVHQPRVLPTSSGYVMAYAGYTGEVERPQVGFADSVDGVTWACEWPFPALDTSDLTGDGVHTIAAFQFGDNPALLVEWLTDGGTDVYLAEFGLGG
jgi:predicted GH43/DUF377 family glycosyl hydrolase